MYVAKLHVPAWLPTALQVDHEAPREEIYGYVDTYKREVMVRMTEVGDLAKTHVNKAQQTQKKQHDCCTRPMLKVGGRVFVYMPRV